MKIKNISFLVFSLLFSLSALRADDQNSNDLVLKLSDANVPHTIVFDQNNTASMPEIIFELPIIDNGGSWAYNMSIDGHALIIPIGVDPNHGRMSINDFTNQLEWNESFLLTCLPYKTGTTTVDFYYFDTSHMIVQTCEFKINIVAPTPADPATTTSTSTTK